MHTISEIQTEQPGLYLARLQTVEDAENYFYSVQRSKEHLKRFNSETVRNHSNLEKSIQSIMNPSNPDRLRMAIMADNEFAGSINITPHSDGDEIGYWLDVHNTGRGYATMSVKALTKYWQATRLPERIYGLVNRENQASVAVLQRAGYIVSCVLTDEISLEYVD